MTVGLSATAANSQLDTLVGTYNWVQLHVGDPGAAGTANQATETTRMQASFAAATGGSVATSADLLWEDAPATETYTHFSVWDASTSGNFGFSGTITADQIVTGEDFRIPSGDLTATHNLAA